MGEEAKKAEAAAKEKARTELVSGFAGYGSSSSDDEPPQEDAQQPSAENGKESLHNQAEENQDEMSKLQEKVVSSESEEEPPASLPPGFFAKPEVPDKVQKPKEEKPVPETKKRKAEFGTDDFWS